MSAETFDTSPMLNLQNWCQALPDSDGYLLTDPIDREHLNFGVVPRWVQEEPTYREGLAFLASTRVIIPRELPKADEVDSRIHITDIYSRHQWAEDLGPVSKAWFERRVAASDYFGFEYAGHSAQEIEDFIAIAHLALGNVNDPATSFEDYTRRHEEAMAERYGRLHPYESFLARIGHAVALSNTPVFSSDVRTDSPAVVEDAYLEAMRRLVESEPFAEEGAVYAALINAREWIQAANTSTQMLLFERKSASDKVSITTLTDGDLHQDKSRKLRLLGADVTPVFMGRFLPPSPISLPAIYGRGRLSSFETDCFRIMLFGLRYGLQKSTFQARILDELRADASFRAEWAPLGIPGQRTEAGSHQEAARFLGERAAGENVLR